MQINGRLAIVTGSSSGIGEATAKALANRQARLVLLARSEQKLSRVAESIEAEGGSAIRYPVNLADAEAVAEIAGRIRADVGVPDIIVNNAGVGRWIPLSETSAEEGRQMMEVPYLAAMYMTREFVAEMVERGSGHLVSVTSPASFLVWPNACGYIAARHALRGLTDALRAELTNSGVNVTLAVFGTVESPYWEHNPGSRENMPRTIPWLMPTLTTDKVAAEIVRAIEKNRRQLVVPNIFRCLFLMHALFPRLSAKMMSRRRS